MDVAELLRLLPELLYPRLGVRDIGRLRCCSLAHRQAIDENVASFEKEFWHSRSMGKNATVRRMLCRIPRIAALCAKCGGRSQGSPYVHWRGRRRLRFCATCAHEELGGIGATEAAIAAEIPKLSKKRVAQIRRGLTIARCRQGGALLYWRTEARATARVLRAHLE